MENDKNKHIAVVGVSTDPEKYGHKIFRDCIEAGYDVTGINPKGGEMFGRKIFPRLSDLSFTPDIVITVVPPAITESIIEDCHTLGIKKVWMQPGSESAAAIEKAEKYGIETIHDRCFMRVHDIWK
jgi:uncharacterized protein